MESKSKSKSKRKRGIARLLEVSGSKKKHLITAGILSVLGSIAKMMIYLFVYFALQEIVKSRGIIADMNGSVMLKIILGAASALLVWLLFDVVASLLSHSAAFNLLYELRIQLSEKLPKLPLGYFNTHSTGEIKNVMNNDVERIESFVAHNILDFVTGIVTPILTLIFLFAIDWRMALACLISIPVAGFAGVNMFSNKKIKALSDKYQLSMGKMNGSAIEYINGIVLIKTFAKGKEIYNNLKQDIKSSGQSAITWSDASANSYILFLTLLPASILFIFPMAIFLLSNPMSYNVALTSVLLFFVIGINIAEPMKQLMMVSSIFRKVSFGMECIDDILDAEELAADESALEPIDSRINFNNVHFAYSKKKVLDDISFSCLPGTVTALVGPSGAGKSTIAKLIARFWDVSGGEIEIGGHNIKTLTNESLMNKVSFVFQDVVILSDTIEENIRMGNKTASMDQVVAAAKAAQIHAFIEKLPGGYQTKLGTDGIYLSGGEAQRISIARVFLRNTPIIVFDEATAYADAENESLVQEAFRQLAKDKTVIVIAHRLSAIVGADQILLIDKGTIKERGTHNELLEQKGLYNDMWQRFAAGESWSLKKNEVTQ